MSVFRSVPILIAVTFLGIALALPAAADTLVDEELSLVIDVSGSIDASEFALQMDGYANAFRNQGVRNAILSTAGGDVGQIAVNVVFFGSNVYPTTLQNWRLLDSDADILAFANLLDNIARPGSGGTAIALGMQAGSGPGAGLGLLENGYSGAMIMDVSGDGTDNVQGPNAVQAARNFAQANNITVNGLAIQNDVPNLLAYYQANVITAGAYSAAVSNFADFEAAIIAKLGYELGAVPEPTTLALLGVGLAGLAASRRRRRRRAD